MISLTLMSLVTSVKDYVEITHKFIELEPLKNYTELGALFTYIVVSIGNILKDFFSFSIFKNIWSIPIIVPDIASAMISEISVLDGYFHNAFTFLDSRVTFSLGSPDFLLGALEKFFIGLINSFFLFLPTSTSHLITLRRFVMQGLEAGYISGLGTVAGNLLWLSSVILGCRFFVIPWLSFDIFRYVLGFILLVKYIWDSSKERRMPLENLSKWKIFLLNFLLALTEQTCIYPFISNLSFGPEASLLEGFAVENYPQFLLVHGAYLAGIFLGSFSLLQFACWFWENPAFSIYIWITTKASNSSFSSDAGRGTKGVSLGTSSYYKILNFIFLYGTMLCAISSIPYYGLDYTLTNPIGLVPQDRIIDQKKSQFDTEKMIPETAFLGVNPTDKNTRVRDGVHARRERWKQRLIKYQAYDASIYDQSVYDFLTIEDLNYGFDRFWLRRKMRNHQIRFRLFPGPWMRSLKKQLNKPASLNNKQDNSSKSATGPRVEFFRILFEQFYHPNFHDRVTSASIENLKPKQQNIATPTGIAAPPSKTQQSVPVLASISAINLFNTKSKQIKSGLIYEHSALRKFVRNFNTRTNLKILNNNRAILPNLSIDANLTSVQKTLNNKANINGTSTNKNLQTVYSKRWKSLFSKIQPYTKTSNYRTYLLFRNISKQILLTDKAKSLKLTNINQKISPTDLKILTNLTGSTSTTEQLTLLRPLAFYLQKEKAFKRKLRYYGSTTMRKLTVGNQAPYLKTLMKRGFYYYKPSLRFKKTLYVASMRRGFRKKSRKQKNLTSQYYKNQEGSSVVQSSIIANNPVKNYVNITPTGASLTADSLTGPSSFKDQRFLIPNRASYSILNKRASRYRHQIYKDVLQHWYYTPFNRLALKFDIDAFINRQPKSHFLTKNEERLLHIKRFLLSEHYDTLRWYTYMQHYRTMKENIGGTKSFASRVYNQQFQGTFKKIRHLFAITPSQENFSILKFDQPLYNDNKLANLLYFHEELLTDNSPSIINKGDATNPNISKFPPSGRIDVASSNLTKVDFPINSAGDAAIPEGYSKGYSNKDELINQANYLISKQMLNSENQIPYSEQNSIASSLNKNKETSLKIKGDAQLVYNELLVKLIKECKRQIYDQTFLKNYISHRIDKVEQRNQEHIKELNKRLEKLKTWLTFEKSESNTKIPTDRPTESFRGQGRGDSTTWPEGPSGMQKAFNDSILNTYNINPLYSNKPLLLNQKLKFKTKFSNFSNSLRTEEYIKTKLLDINKVLKAFLSKQNDSNINKNKEEMRSQLQGAKNLLSVCKKIINNKIQLLKIRTNKNLDWWRKKQRVITKRKNARKRDRFKKQMAGVNANIEKLLKKANKVKGQRPGEKAAPIEKSNLYKILYGNYDISDYMWRSKNSSTNINPADITKNMVSKKQEQLQIIDSTSLRKKQDLSADVNSVFTKDLTYVATEPQKDNTVRPSFNSADTQTNKSTIWQQFFIKKFRKKMSSKGRRYRALSYGRYLTATRKPKTVGADIPGDNEPLNGLSKIDGISSTDGFFLKKKDKVKRLFLEKLIAEGADTKLIKQSLSDTTLKKGPIYKRSRHTWKKFKRHKFNTTQNKYRKRRIQSRGKLRVMSKKFKKIKATQELRQWWWNSFLPRYYNSLISNLQSSQNISVQNSTKVSGFGSVLAAPTKGAQQALRDNDAAFKPLSKIDLNLRNGPSGQITLQEIKNNTVANNNIVNSSEMALTTIPEGELRSSNNIISNNLDVRSTTNVPFYAGWDESLRKFIVTNRLLTRRDAGLEIKTNNGGALSQNVTAFSNTPIQGLNEGSFLYSQTDMAFNSYNIDQFIATNQSFYAPLGWRRFEFRHSILKSWYAKMGYNNTQLNQNSLILSEPPYKDSLALQNRSNYKNTYKKGIARRIKKRYKLLKQTPSQLMYTPTGPLLSEVLPSHYISVFDQQYRFPRNRYLKRNLSKTLKKTALLSMLDCCAPEGGTARVNFSNKTKTPEFTLRKRVKPRRKYHRKRFIKKDGLIFPRRTKFTTTNPSSEGGDQLRWRPSSRTKQKRTATERTKSKINKRVKTNPLRLRQLRRREFQQIIKPMQRYQPRNGGFTWPGDYLRLEVVEMPKLISNVDNTQLTKNIDSYKKSKQKILVQPVGIMPRKYLIEKHNILVLKKKLEKAHSSHRLTQAIKEYKLLTQNSI